MTIKSSGSPTSGSGPTPNVPNLPTTPSWAGGSTGSGTNDNIFDAPATKKFGGQLLSDANVIYNQGPKVFNQSLYAGLSDTTRDALNGMLGVDTSTFDQGMGGAMDYYSRVARGEMMGQDDPNYARIRQKMIDDTIASTGAAFTSLGRNASDAHASTLAGTIGDTLAGMDYQRLQDDYARRDAATAALPGMLQAQMMPGQFRFGVGQIFDQDAQAQRTAENDLFRRINDAPYTHVANNVNLLTGGAGENGPLTPDAPWWQSLLGFGGDLLGKAVGGIKIGF